VKRRPPKVKASSAFVAQGKLKAAGPMAALPFNPHPYARCPAFRIGFNGRWHEVELVDACETYGWVAASVIDIKAELDVVPKVELRRR
jgi:hypothetical protein